MAKRINKRRILPENYEGQRLKAYLRTHDIRSPELAERLGLSVSAVQSYFYRSLFTDATRRNIAKALGVSYEQIVGLPIDLSTIAHRQGEQLRLYLERKGIPQTQLARALGRSKTSINGYLNSEVLQPRSRQLIANALQVSESDIFPVPDASLPAKQIVLPKASTDPVDAITDPALLARQQLEQWQRLLTELRSAGASTVQINFCQYQIWHLEASLSNLTLSDPL